MTPSSITASAHELSMRSAPAELLHKCGCKDEDAYALEHVWPSPRLRPTLRAQFPAVCDVVILQVDIATTAAFAP
jgi:hypothetical protein